MKHILSLGLLLAWSTAQSVELGAVSLTSVSGEPLRAQIPILLAKGESLEQLAASIIESTPSLPDIHLVLTAGASPHINLSSKKPITEKKLALTLQISQPDEDTEYHYELALSPSGALGSANHGKPYVYGPVKVGDTLWQVANHFAKHYTMTSEQAMAALYAHNKKAFGNGNQNQLMAGSYLKLPSRYEKAGTTKHPTLHFKPTDVVSQSHPIEPLWPKEPTTLAVVDPVTPTPTVIPEFPLLEEGKQVAVNLSAALPGVPALKLLNPLTDANTALFSSTLNSVLGSEDKAFVKLLDTMQHDLKMAREAIDLERQAKQVLQSQVNDLQIQLRALTELISLQHSQGRAPTMTESIPSLFEGAGNNPIVLLMAAIAMASLLMVAWEYFMGPKVAPVPTSPAPRPAAIKTHGLKPRMASLSEVDRSIHQGRYYQAQEMLGAILSKQPSDFDALYKLCQVYVKSDNRTAYETKLDQISPRWRTMYPERYQRLQGLYDQAWASMRVAREGGVPVYEGDPPADPVQTKLDLARAYIDIGDQPSAHEILTEVLKEGTPAQVLSAQLLIDQIKPWHTMSTL